MKHSFLLLALGLGACATPPARYDAFAEVMRSHASATAREAERVQLLDIPAIVEPTPAPAPRRPGRRARAPLPVVASQPAPGLAGCAAAASLTPAARERCGLAERLRLTALARAHANALAAYSASMGYLATRFDPLPATAALAAARAEMLATGERLEQELGVSAAELEPFRPVPARVGLRPAFAAEMASHGWQMRQQLALQAAALERLETIRAGQADEALQRLRWSMGFLRSGFEKLIVSDRAALADIEQARRALEG